MTNSENETVSLLEAIYLSTSDAPKTLARIAMYIAINPERVLKLNVTDLAQQTGSGKASIVRYCQTLGYSGFREFKIALSGEIERDRTRRLASRPKQISAVQIPKFRAFIAPFKILLKTPRSF